jgi:hypothetical protein
MSYITSEVLAVLVTVYGVAAGAAALFQARSMIVRGSSCEVSARFLAVHVGGYGIWLLYGVLIASPPLVVVNTTGLAFSATTLVVALRLRGSLAHPSTWANCGR